MNCSCQDEAGEVIVNLKHLSKTLCVGSLVLALFAIVCHRLRLCKDIWQEFAHTWERLISLDTLSKRFPFYINIHPRRTQWPWWGHASMRAVPDCVGDISRVVRRKESDKRQPNFHNPHPHQTTHHIHTPAREHVTV